MPDTNRLRDDFSHVSHWVFDLDHTLYPPEMALFDQIEVRMSAWVQEVLKVSATEADRLRRVYWEKYGTTLAGLMREHNVDPDRYLHDVHDISFDHMTVDHDLVSHIKALPGRRIVYTNGSEPYARNVLAARGLSDCFDAVYGVEHADYHPKPERQAFDKVFGLDGVDGSIGAMFEDDARNLAVPHALGMQCVHVAPEHEPADHIHHHTDDLTAFLSQLTA